MYNRYPLRGRRTQTSLPLRSQFLRVAGDTPRYFAASEIVRCERLAESVAVVRVAIRANPINQDIRTDYTRAAYNGPPIVSSALPEARV